MIRWNNENPFDKMYREKYKIPFNSPQHRELKQKYQKGEWLTEREVPKQDEEELFGKIDIGKFNSQSSQLEIE